MQLIPVGGIGTLSFNSLIKRLLLVSIIFGVLRRNFSYGHIIFGMIGVDLRENTIAEGPLRPYPISHRRPIPAHIDQTDWALDGISKIEPNSNLQHHVEIAREVLDAAACVIRPGFTTDEIDAVFHEEWLNSSLVRKPLLIFWDLGKKQMVSQLP
ncbi:Methionine aminopeptidase 1A [Abeliophyllum distichum]|uniref:Methionine aminopeptidase 1A n=1 Tax=Abeliophyllum distichum TaxID=126358 RepID=A0ABD1SZ59_9LAMI